MSARFRVADAFSIESRRLFVLAGEIVDGVVRPGMSVLIDFNDVVQMHAPIVGVEEIRASDPRKSVGLTIDYEDDLGLALWRGLNIGGGEVIEVVERSPDPSTPPSNRHESRARWWKFW